MSTYKEKSEQLDVLVEELQSGNLDIDESIKKYEEAIKLIKELEKYLQTAENSVTKLKDSLS